jgi:hypothetical protein
MSSSAQLLLLAAGGSVCVLNLVVATLRHFRGRGPSPGSLGAFVLLLIVLFVQEWPLWTRFALAPLAIAAEFLWLPAYFLLDRVFPRQRR